MMQKAPFYNQAAHSSFLWIYTHCTTQKCQGTDILLDFYYQNRMAFIQFIQSTLQ